MPKLLYTWYFEKFTASVTSSDHSALRHEVSRICTILFIQRTQYKNYFIFNQNICTDFPHKPLLFIICHKSKINNNNSDACYRCRYRYRYLLHIYHTNCMNSILHMSYWVVSLIAFNFRTTTICATLNSDNESAELIELTAELAFIALFLTPSGRRGK